MIYGEVISPNVNNQQLLDQSVWTPVCPDTIKLRFKPQNESSAGQVESNGRKSMLDLTMKVIDIGDIWRNSVLVLKSSYRPNICWM